MKRFESEYRLRPFFLDGTAGKLFALCYEPTGGARGQVLFCPPFAEEMNKSRRMTAMTARRLAANGFRVLTLDLYGTGDSAGIFDDARWQIWIDDLVVGYHWLMETGADSTVLWGTRLGASMALTVATQCRIRTGQVMLWQPVLYGAAFMTQFLRLKLAAELTGAGPKTTTADIRAAARNGEAVEVAGYALHPELIEAIDALDFRRLDVWPGVRIAWIDLGKGPHPEPGPASRKICEAWLESGIDLEISAVAGESFWTTPEITVVPELIDRTIDHLARTD